MQDKWKAEELEHEAKEAPIKDAAREYLSSLGYVMESKSEITEGKIYVKFDVNENGYKFTATKYTKKGGQKQWRLHKSYNVTDFNNIEFGMFSSDKTINNTASGWVLPSKIVAIAPTQVKQTIAVTAAPEQTETISNDIKIVQYSEKAIVVTGNTYRLKDKLKEIGGKFNPYLKGGAGWIFPKTKIMEVDEALSS